MSPVANQRLSAMRILWGAILMASVFESSLSLILPSPPVHKIPEIMPIVLGVVAVAVAAVSFWLPTQPLRAAFGSYRDRVEEVVTTPEEGSYRGENRRRRVLRLDAAALTRVLNISQTGMILSIALSNAIALFGLVLNRVGFPLFTSAPFFVAGTFLIAIRFPTLEAILGRVARVVEAEVEIDG